MNPAVHAVAIYASAVIVAASFVGAAVESGNAPLPATLFSLCAALGLVVFVALSLIPPSRPNAPEGI